MKGNVVRGAGFRGVLNYLLMEEGTNQPRPGAYLAGGNLDGHDPRNLANEFAVSRKLRPDIERPVWHTSLSLPEGEKLTDERWQEAAEKLMAKVGMDPNFIQWTLVRHDDTDYEHAHLVASRIGLDGSIWYGRWEARAVHRATQEIEQEMGLILTPGPETAEEDYRQRPGTKSKGPQVKIAQKERLAWESKGVAIPPKVEVASALEVAINNGDGTLEDLKQRLELEGIVVHVNQAKTGRINGLSFELERGGETCRYKASQIHKSYGWKNLKPRLEARRVEYGQGAGDERQGLGTDSGTPSQDSRVDQRDFEIAAELVASSRANWARGFGKTEADWKVERANNEFASEFAELSGVDSRTNDASAGFFSAAGGGIRAEREAACGANERDFGIARGFGETSRGVSGTDGSSIEFERRDTANISEPFKSVGRDTQAAKGKYRTNSTANKERDTTRTRSKYKGIKRKNRRYTKSETRWGRRMAWSTRFKIASKRKRLPNFDGKRGTKKQESYIEYNKISEAKRIDPRPFFESIGFEVRDQGRHLSIVRDGQKYFKSTIKEDGQWVHCHLDETGVGDNIDLVRELYDNQDMPFAEAVYLLLGDLGIDVSSSRPQTKAYNPKPASRPRLPRETWEAQEQGRQYLEGRGISWATLEWAESLDFVRYVGSGPVFCGYDGQGKIRNATKREIDSEAEVSKRDFTGSDKTYPPILPGNARHAWVVEDGIDALAVRDLHSMYDHEPPTVIVSGGSGVRKWLNNPEVQDFFRQASKVVVAFENEDTPEKQAKTDRGYKKQMEGIGDYTDCQIDSWRPPKEVKDLGELMEQLRAEQRVEEVVENQEPEIDEEEFEGPELRM